MNNSFLFDNSNVTNKFNILSLSYLYPIYNLDSFLILINW